MASMAAVAHRSRLPGRRPLCGSRNGAEGSASVSAPQARTSVCSCVDRKFARKALRRAEGSASVSPSRIQARRESRIAQVRTGRNPLPARRFRGFQMKNSPSEAAILPGLRRFLSVARIFSTSPLLSPVCRRNASHSGDPELALPIPKHCVRTRSCCCACRYYPLFVAEMLRIPTTRNRLCQFLNIVRPRSDCHCRSYYTICRHKTQLQISID